MLSSILYGSECAASVSDVDSCIIIIKNSGILLPISLYYWEFQTKLRRTFLLDVAYVRYRVAWLAE
jgi:hypothetical protein